jgi:hypothetical protein
LRQIPADERRLKVLSFLRQKLALPLFTKNKKRAQERVRDVHRVLASHFNNTDISHFFEWDSIHPGSYPLVAQNGIFRILEPQYVMHPMYYLLCIDAFLSEGELEQLIDAPFHAELGHRAMPWIVAPMDLNVGAAQHAS